MLRLPLSLVLGVEPPPKRKIFSELCASREGSSTGGECSRESSLSPISTRSFKREAIQRVPLSSDAAQVGGFLPPNVLTHILRHVDHADLKALHRVSRAWREAVCYGLRTLAPATCAPAMLKRFPKVEIIGMERVHFREPHLAKLTGLRTLIVHDCTFSHPISDLSSLTGLERLKLVDVKADSKQADLLLSGLTSLTSLEVIRFSGQKLLPTFCKLSCLTGLQDLVISDSHHRERLAHLTQLSSLQSLQRVTILKVRVDGSIVRSLAGVFGLQRLEIPDCYRVTDSAMPSLSHLTGLTKLDMRSVYHRREEDLSDEGVGNLATLTGLRSLNLSGHKSLTSAGLRFLGDMTDLVELSLFEVPLWTGGADFLSRLTTLTSLNIARTHLTDEHLSVCSSLRGLVALDASETYLGNGAARHIAEMKQLQSLRAAFCALGNDGMGAIVAGCPSLTYVNVDGCCISTLAMMHVARHHRDLKFWQRAGDSSLPEWMYKIDTVLIAQTEPYTRRLRVLHQGEGRFAVTTGVFLAVICFFMAYFLGLFLVFIAVFLLPLAALGVVCLLVGVLALAIKVAIAVAEFLCTCVMYCQRLCGGIKRAAETEAPREALADMV